MYHREETEYFRAKRKAARRLGSGEVKGGDLPSNREIRDQIRAMARRYEGERRAEQLREMRVEALRMMRILRAFQPRLIGGPLTDQVQQGSAIDLHVFSDSLQAVCGALDAQGISYQVDRKRVGKPGQEGNDPHIHIQDRFRFELTVCRADLAHQVFCSPLTGEPLQRADLAEMEALIAHEYPPGPPEQPAVESDGLVDRFQVYEMLLLPLEQVKESHKHHPEGDALYHSLQVFDLARQALPYDEEFLLAALLHDVGKAIDPKEHVAAALEALDGFITPRTAWLIEHHQEGLAWLEGTLGVRSRRRLEAAEDFEELKLLARCDRNGRARGVRVPDLVEALQSLRELARACGE